MNSVSIIIAVAFFLCVLVGWAKGLFKSILSVAGLVASIVVAVYVAPHVSGYLEKETQTDEKIATIMNHYENVHYKELEYELDNGEKIEIFRDRGGFIPECAGFGY